MAQWSRQRGPLHWLNSPRSHRSSNASNRILRISCSTPPGQSPAPDIPAWSDSKTGQITRYKFRTDDELATPMNRAGFAGGWLV